MNNLNDPPNWNIHPNGGDDGGHGSKWNYALLVPMLGLAAFRWIWSRESQKEIEKEKKQFYQKLSTVQRELESKYRDIITENRRSVAHLELELEKERNRTSSYREALVSQSRKLVEERRTLEKEHAQLEQERSILQRSGAAGALYQSCLEKEAQWQKRASALLKEFEETLIERQEIYCSLMLPRHRRLEVEKDLLIRAATDPIALDLGMEDLRIVWDGPSGQHCKVLRERAGCNLDVQRAEIPHPVPKPRFAMHGLLPGRCQRLLGEITETGRFHSKMELHGSSPTLTNH